GSPTNPPRNDVEHDAVAPSVDQILKIVAFAAPRQASFDVASYKRDFFAKDARVRLLVIRDIADRQPVYAHILRACSATLPCMDLVFGEPEDDILATSSEERTLYIPSRIVSSELRGTAG